MGFYTEFVFTHNGITYSTCDRDGFEKFADKNIEKLANDLILYKEYIKNMLCFLNINRTDKESIWPQWHINSDPQKNCGDNMYIIEFANDCSVNVHYSHDLALLFSSTKSKRSVEFVRFLNIRFFCNKIWKKYNLPKDMINYIQDKYF